MKLVLNEVEVKEAIETFVKNKCLRDYGSFEVQVLDIMDVDGVSLDLENKVTFEVGVLRTSPGAASRTPLPPVASMPQF